MEFDKSKVYTAVNADEVKAGSCGFVSKTYSNLKEMVENNRLLCLVEIKEILPDNEEVCFVCNAPVNLTL